MNVRIFWVRAMKCMCAQTRPRFILSSERVFWGMEFEPKLTPREKSPVLENFLRGGSNLRHCGQRAQILPTSYSGPGFDSNCCHGSFSRSCHTSDLKVSTPVATLPDAWCSRVLAGSCWPVVSILWLGEMESLFCSFYLAALAIASADLSLRYASILLGHYAANKQQHQCNWF